LRTLVNYYFLLFDKQLKINGCHYINTINIQILYITLISFKMFIECINLI